MARTWSTRGLINRGCRESSRATITSLLSRHQKHEPEHDVEGELDPAVPDNSKTLRKR